jgi:GNAT superfamily N-acetyltransferase
VVSGELVIRAAGEEDRAAVRAVVRAAWEEAYSHIYAPEVMADFFEDRLPESGSWTDGWDERLGRIVAEQDGRIVGVAGLALRTDGDGELTQLYVLPEAQGQGVGTALWNAGVEVLRRQGCAGMQVWVLARAPAVRFYARRGAVPAGEGTYTVGAQSERALCYRLQL